MIFLRQCIRPGSIINYTINYGFTGLGSNTTIIDYLPKEVNYNWSSPSGNYNATGGTVT